MSLIEDLFERFDENIEIVKKNRFDQKVDKFIKKGNLQKLEEVFPELNHNDPLKIEVIKKLGNIGSVSSFNLIEKDFSRSKFRSYSEEFLMAEIDAMKKINQPESKKSLLML